MKHIGVAILGTGVVGGGTFSIINTHNAYYKKTQNVDLEVMAVLEIRKERAIAIGVPEDKIRTRIEDVVNDPNIDVVVEAIGGIEPSKTFILQALSHKKHVVTPNKELLAKHFYELEAVAKANGVNVFFEASCVGGVPVIKALINSLQADKINSLYGIVNGTTNYILSKMTSEGGSFDEILKEAQKLGFAEANPSADVDGFDCVYKLSILSSLAFHTKISYTNIYREGIRGVTEEDIAFAKELGLTVKLLAIAKRRGDSSFELRVHPTLIKKSHPLAAVSDSFNAVYINGDSVGDVMLYGRGAGALPTGSAIVSDVIYAAERTDLQYSTFKNTEFNEEGVTFVDNFRSRYYVRITAEDKSGVLARATECFAKSGVNISDVVQKSSDDEHIPVIFLLGETDENSIKAAVELLKATDGISSVNAVLRVEK